MNPKQQNSNRGELSPDLIRQFLENQKQELTNQAQSNRLQEKQIDANVRLAEKQMEIQGDLLKQKPSETRSTFNLFAIWVVAIILIILGFLVICIYLGKDEFALNFFGKFMYLVIAVISYLAGKKSSSKPGQVEKERFDDAEIVD